MRGGRGREDDGIFKRKMWSTDRSNTHTHTHTHTTTTTPSHKSTSDHSKMSYPPTKTLRLSGSFDFFNVNTRTHTQVGENDLSFKLVKNRAGGWNVDGRGRNAYGNFFLTGELDENGRDIELYKHFPPRNTAASKKGVASPKALLPSPAAAALLEANPPPALPPAKPIEPLRPDEIQMEEGLEPTKEPIDAK